VETILIQFQMWHSQRLRTFLCRMLMEDHIWRIKDLLTWLKADPNAEIWEKCIQMKDLMEMLEQDSSLLEIETSIDKWAMVNTTLLSKHRIWINQILDEIHELMVTLNLVAQAESWAQDNLNSTNVIRLKYQVSRPLQIDRLVKWNHSMYLSPLHQIKIYKEIQLHLRLTIHNNSPK